ncbi:MAG: glycosyltransferase family 39 protein, partial [Anaerolineales bacterium]|nr:glycosyltransferase family 39 protein [Anaerolineales bacterium]
MTWTRHGYRAVWVAVLLLAFGLRLHRLEAQSFWNDEGNSARLSERPLHAIIEGTASDVHPPLYYLILHGWRQLVGESEFGLRSFSLFVGLGTVAVTMALAGKMRRSKGAGGQGRMWLVGVLTAVSPPLIYYSQETRMYALLAFEAALATLLIYDLRAKRRAATLTIGDWRLANGRWQLTIDHWRLTILYALIITAGLYTHYFFPAVILAHGLYVVLQTRKPANLQTGKLANLLLAPFLLAALVAGLLYLPWLPIFWRQTGGRVDGGGSPLAFLQAAGAWLVGGETLPVSQVMWPLGTAVLLILLTLITQKKRALLPLLMLLVPLAFMFASGATQPQYFKFLGVAAPFWGMLVAGGWWLVPGKRNVVLSLVSSLLLVVVLVGNGRALHNLYVNPAYARADYRAM